MKNKILVFTKPWKEESLEELAFLVKKMGFDGVELPVREGYQVNPENVKNELLHAKEILQKQNLIIGSIAGSLEKNTIEAMGTAGISLLRVCIKIDMEKGYFKSVKEIQEKILGFQSILEKNKVKIGIQNHHGFNVGSALGIYHLLEPIPNTISGAVLDFAHCELAGEPSEMAYDILKNNLLLINFKSAIKVRINGPDETEAKWQIHWVTARNSLYSWENAVKILKNAHWNGPICIPAEYNHIGSNQPIMGNETISRATNDLAYLKLLLER
jgi:sugar phosphate isomerase/epimerase